MSSATRRSLISPIQELLCHLHLKPTMSYMPPLDALTAYASSSRPLHDIPPQILLASDDTTLTIFDKFPKGAPTSFFAFSC